LSEATEVAAVASLLSGGAADWPALRSVTLAGESRAPLSLAPLLTALSSHPALIELNIWANSDPHGDGNDAAPLAWSLPGAELATLLRHATVLQRLEVTGAHISDVAALAEGIRDHGTLARVEWRPTNVTAAELRELHRLFAVNTTLCQLRLSDAALTPELAALLQRNRHLQRQRGVRLFELLAARWLPRSDPHADDSGRPLIMSSTPTVASSSAPSTLTAS
jgi:hypothetical protein